MLGAGLPGMGGLGGSEDGQPNLDSMMQAMQNPGMQQLMQQLLGQPGFMEVRVLHQTQAWIHGCAAFTRRMLLLCRGVQYTATMGFEGSTRADRCV